MVRSEGTALDPFRRKLVTRCPPPPSSAPRQHLPQGASGLPVRSYQGIDAFMAEPFGRRALLLLPASRNLLRAPAHAQCQAYLSHKRRRHPARPPRPGRKQFRRRLGTRSVVRHPRFKTAQFPAHGAFCTPQQPPDGCRAMPLPVEKLQLCSLCAREVSVGFQCQGLVSSPPLITLPTPSHQPRSAWNLKPPGTNGN